MLNILLVIFSVIFVLLCAFLIILVLVQPGKSGGLANMGASSPIEGPSAFTETLGIERTDKAMFNWTATASVSFFVLTLVLTFLGNARDHAAGQINLPDAPAAEATSNVVVPALPAGAPPMPPAEDPAPATP